MLGDKIVLITGGTGSFGNAVTRRLLDTGIEQVRIFSRDECKQEAMRNSLNDNRVKFYIGDVRNPESLKEPMRGVNVVVHAAAQKQVPAGEFFPMEAIRTNVLGSENVFNAAVDAGVEKVIALSTDKACLPINAYGQSKALMEKLMIAKSRSSSVTVFCATRYGNVLGSRGSVVPHFIEQARAGKPLTVTNPEMTRFLMTLDDAVNLVAYAFERGKQGDIFVQKSPAATVFTLAAAIHDTYNGSGIKGIGTRLGEKLFETLVTCEEMAHAEESEKYYRIVTNTRGLDYSLYVDKGGWTPDNPKDYTSHNTTRLNKEETTALLVQASL